MTTKICVGGSATIACLLSTLSKEAYNCDTPGENDRSKHVDWDCDSRDEDSPVESQNCEFGEAKGECIEYFSHEKVLEKMRHEGGSQDPEVQSISLSNP